MNLTQNKSQVVVIGGGPAGLMAAEVIAQAGFTVSVYDAMPSVGRKFLLAGVGGMNITHSEPHKKLLGRYRQALPYLQPSLDAFSAQQLCLWIHALGIETFIGSSGRVFPADMKAAPLLRAWLHRLRNLGVKIIPRQCWLGWADDQQLRMADHSADEVSEKNIHADAVVLALGGGSWQRLGSNGAWVNILREKNISITPLLPSNCGFECDWTNLFKAQFAGTPLLTVSFTVMGVTQEVSSIRGEAVITQEGIEGTSIYALSAQLRELILTCGKAQLRIDLLPDFELTKIVALLAKPRDKNSTSNFLRKKLNLSPVKLALLRELTPIAIWKDNMALAQAIKCLPLTLTRFRPIDEAISSAGGVQFDELNSHLMLTKLPGVFCAGEMLDWEAPTGGYLLTACFATGRAAGFGVVDFLTAKH